MRVWRGSSKAGYGNPRNALACVGVGRGHYGAGSGSGSSTGSASSRVSRCTSPSDFTNSSVSLRS